MTDKFYKTDREQIEITEEFNRALQLMEGTRQHIYVTGKAGTGKSTLLREFCDHTLKKIVVLAPTGVAAINVDGQTIHSFFQFPFGIISEADIHALKNKREIFKNLDAVVIDEISMVRADLMSAIDVALRKNTGKKNRPFGGVQMIMFGDLYQLPPVVKKDEEAFLRDIYGGVYFFKAKVWQETDMQKICLTKIFRQEDEGFKNILNKVREKRIDGHDLDLLNTRFKMCDERSGPVIILAATNQVVHDINTQRLAELSGVEYVFQARVRGDFDEKDYPTDGELRLKVGAQVMMIKNDTGYPRRWVNGTLGVVRELGENHVAVEIDNEVQIVEPTVWELNEYSYNLEKKEIEKNIKGTFVQLPLKLAWAVTIHKSQGKTFERAIIDFGRGAFAHGQAYVALSRCTSFEGVHLRTRMRFSDIIVDKEVNDFHQVI